MQPYSGGHPVDANFDVETEEGRQTVLFRSRGGGRTIRNTEYNEGLELILRRLGQLGAKLDRVAVDSADTRRAGLTLDERTLGLEGLSYPIELGSITDMADLRLMLGRAQAAIGRPVDASGSGNYTKQIRLYPTLPTPLSDTELADSLGYGSRILVVALPQSAKRNLEWGLDNGIWGFPVPRFETTEAQRLADYKALRRGDHVLILSGYNGGGPRAPFEQWVGPDGSEHSFEDCYLCVVNEPYHRDEVPFWPDEDGRAASRYPHRIGIDPSAIGSLSLRPHVDLTPDVIDAVRRSHLQGAQGFMADAVGSPALTLRSAPAVPIPGQPAGASPPTAKVPTGQGRSVDPIRRRRVEERAMQLAEQHYVADGWSVEDVSTINAEEDGTPYDLKCRKGPVTRHVEVKGTTGAGDTVLVSANERTHATDLGGAESYLFVVSGIGLKTVKGVLRAVGGDIRYHGPFIAEADRFTATQYRYSVPS